MKEHFTADREVSELRTCPDFKKTRRHPSHAMQAVVVADSLRRQTRNLLEYSRAGSNSADYEVNEFQFLPKNQRTFFF